MTRQEQALGKFEEGYDCSKAVFTVFAPLIGIEEDRRKIFDTRNSWTLGMPQKWCGAVTGAWNVLELYLKAKGRKGRIETLCETFKNEFSARNGSVVCTELLGFDLANPQDVGKIIENGLCDDLCRKFIRDSVELVEKLLEPYSADQVRPGPN